MGYLLPLYPQVQNVLIVSLQSSWQNVAVSPDLWMIATTLQLVPETIIYDPGAGKEHDVQCLRIGMEWPRRIYGRDCLTHRVVVLCRNRHGKQLNLTQQKHAFTNQKKCTTTQTHTHMFNDPFSGTTRVSRYQKGKTNLDFTKARNSE